VTKLIAVNFDLNMNLFLHDLSLSRRSKAINAVVGGVAIWVCVLIYAFSASPLELELELDLKLDKHSQSQSHSYSYLAKVHIYLNNTEVTASVAS